MVGTEFPFSDGLRSVAGRRRLSRYRLPPRGWRDLSRVNFPVGRPLTPDRRGAESNTRQAPEGSVLAFEAGAWRSDNAPWKQSLAPF